MTGILDVVVSGKAKRTLEARRGRIQALEDFARVAWGVEGQQFVDLLVDGIEWLARRAGTEFLADIADRAWRHFDYESAEVIRDVDHAMDRDLAEEAAIYVGGIRAEATRLGHAHGQLYERGTDRLPRLMEFAVQLYVGTAGPYSPDDPVDVLADLLHWCKAERLRQPWAAWF